MKYSQLLFFLLFFAAPLPAQKASNQTFIIISGKESVDDKLTPEVEKKDDPQETLVRSTALAVLAASFYMLTQNQTYSQEAFLGTTVNDFGKAVSLDLAWSSLKRFYYGNPLEKRTDDLLLSTGKTLLKNTGWAGFLWCQEKGVHYLEEAEWKKTAALLKTNGTVLPQWGLASGVIITEGLDLAGYKKEAEFIRPNKTSATALWGTLPYVVLYGAQQAGIETTKTAVPLPLAITLLAGIQGANLHYNSEKKAHAVTQDVTDLLETIKLKEFLNTLNTTNQKTLAVNFFNKTVAATYFKKEFEVTKNSKTETLIEQIESGAIDVSQHPLLIDVVAAKKSNFFTQWIYAMENVLEKEHNKIISVQSLSDQTSQAIVKTTYLPSVINQYPLFQTSFSTTVIGFLTILRKIIQNHYSPEQPPTQFHYKPLLAENEDSF